MILAVDIGNSSINMGIFRGVDLLRKLKITARPRRKGQDYKRRIGQFLSESGIALPPDGIILSSVVPELTGILSSAVRGLSIGEPIIVTTSLKTGISFDVECPEEIGSDRVANLVAALEIFGSPVLVVDFGTATTISAARDGKYMGGAILPGLRLMSGALHRGTSKLPPVELPPEVREARPAALGKDTAACIISGIIYGTAGGVERLISEIETEYGAFRVVTTGGYSGIMTPFLGKACFPDPDLTLKGLRLIYERNI